MSRADEIAAGLAQVRARIAAACTAGDRDPASVTLIVITKTKPPGDLRILAGLGVHDVGENRDQEAVAKVAALRDVPLTWHFVGQLQRNKAASVARYADVVHSLDRVPLVTALDRGAEHAGRRLQAFVQVDLDTDPQVQGRGGALPDEVPAVCAAVEAAERLQLVGLMAVAPLGEDPAVAFDRLAGIAAATRQEFPAAAQLSAGMSGDLEAAVAAGATHVRVGSAVLGERPSVR